MTQKQWEKILKENLKKADKLGKGIDPGIREVVAVFNALGFKTTASCEGHLDHGVAGPWIDFESEVDTEKIGNKAQEIILRAQKLSDTGNSRKANILFKKAHLLFKKYEKPHLKERKKMADFLDEFYKNREVDFHTRLHIQGFRHSRLENQGAAYQDIQSPSTCKSNLKKYQKEMKEFSNFLKSKL